MGLARPQRPAPHIGLSASRHDRPSSGPIVFLEADEETDCRPSPHQAGGCADRSRRIGAPAHVAPRSRSCGLARRRSMGRPAYLCGRSSGPGRAPGLWPQELTQTNAGERRRGSRRSPAAREATRTVPTPRRLSDSPGPGLILQARPRPSASEDRCMGCRQSGYKGRQNRQPGQSFLGPLVHVRGQRSGLSRPRLPPFCSPALIFRTPARDADRPGCAARITSSSRPATRRIRSSGRRACPHSRCRR